MQGQLEISSQSEKKLSQNHKSVQLSIRFVFDLLPTHTINITCYFNQLLGVERVTIFTQQQNDPSRCESGKYSSQQERDGQIGGLWYRGPPQTGRRKETHPDRQPLLDVPRTHPWGRLRPKGSLSTSPSPPLSPPPLTHSHSNDIRLIFGPLVLLSSRWPKSRIPFFKPTLSPYVFFPHTLTQAQQLTSLLSCSLPHTIFYRLCFRL